MSDGERLDREKYPKLYTTTGAVGGEFRIPEAPWFMRIEIDGEPVRVEVVSSTCYTFDMEWRQSAEWPEEEARLRAVFGDEEADGG